MQPFLFLVTTVLLVSGCQYSLPPASSIASRLLRSNKIDSTNFELFLRAFKEEKVLEIWAKNKAEKAFTKIQTYDFCTSSGELGPKRKEGDLQIPEGCYWIDRFNPNSQFHLSLGLNYPNNSDRILGNPETPGSDIFIHGGCASVGCIPITNSKIEELYALAEEAKRLGQQQIPVHIFPSRNMDLLLQKDSKHRSFWKNLRPIYQYFETNKELPMVRINAEGSYEL